MSGILEKLNLQRAVRLFRRADFLIALLATLVGLALFSFVHLGSNTAAGFRFIENIELRSLDARFNLRGTRPHDENIVIVGLDEKTLQRVGAFPIPRNAYAQMVDQLAKGGAKVIAFDANFPVPEKNSAVEALRKLEAQVPGAPAPVLEKIREIERTSNNDALFAESIKQAGNVVLGHLFLDAERAQSVSAESAKEYLRILSAHSFPSIQKVSHGRDFDLREAWSKAGGRVAEGVYANLGILADSAKSFGFFDDDPDADGTYRRATLALRYLDDFYPSLAIQTVRAFEGSKDQDIIVYIAENGLERIQLGPHLIWTESDGRTLINYAGTYKTYKHYPMIDVITGTVPPDTFKDKIVLFGATAVAIGDIRNTPFASSNFMGVEIHANIIDNILHSNEPGRGFLSRGLNEEMIDVFFILLFGLGLGYVFGRTPPLLATLSALLVLFVFGAVVCFAFTHSGMWLSFVIPAGTLLVNYAGITSYRMIFEEREKRKVRKTFERYVSPGVISLIEKNPKKYFKPGGESKELTIMFSDIRSFTSISEGLTPNELVALLNEYLGEMTEVIFKRWGTLDKYIGDCVMGFWGSPYPQADHAIRGCAAALDMAARLNELNQKWKAEGRTPLAAGIGVNTGIVNVGNMGSTKRFAWTVMGDNVNLASRLEGATKGYHVRIMAGEGTYKAAKDHFVFRDLDYIRVVGKHQPVQVYELLDFATNEEKYVERLALWSEALALYRSGEFGEAIEAFMSVLQRFPDDGPSAVFLSRSEEKAREPVSTGAWDGVWEMKTK